jgi:hypothetical protein
MSEAHEGVRDGATHVNEVRPGPGSAWTLSGPHVRSGLTHLIARATGSADGRGVFTPRPPAKPVALAAPPTRRTERVIDGPDGGRGRGRRRINGASIADTLARTRVALVEKGAGQRSVGAFEGAGAHARCPDDGGDPRPRLPRLRCVQPDRHAILAGVDGIDGLSPARPRLKIARPSAYTWP